MKAYLIYNLNKYEKLYPISKRKIYIGMLDRLVDRQKYMQTDRLIDLICFQYDTQIDRKLDRQKARQIESQIDRKLDR